MTPLIDRMEDLGYGAIWNDLPVMSAWWERIKARPSYAAAFYPGTRISDRYAQHFLTAQQLQAERGY